MKNKTKIATTLRTTCVSIISTLAILALYAREGRAQVAVAPLELVRQQFLSATGVPLAAGCLTFNATGTSTPQAIYTDSTGTFQAPNPYQLDAAGESNIWLSNTGYDLTAYAGVNNTLCSVSLGAQLWQQKNINPFAIINGGSNYIVASGTVDPGSPVAGELAYRSDIPCFRGFTSIWDCFVELTLTQTLTNKSATLDANTINCASNVAGQYARNNGTKLVCAAISQSDVTISIPNNTTFGTLINSLAKISGATGTVTFTSITDTGGVIGIVTANAGLSGNAVIQSSGLVNCSFDGATTSGDYVQISTTQTGGCHDVGATYPTSGQVIGRVLSTNGGAGTYQIYGFGPEIKGLNPNFPTVVYNTIPAAGTSSIAATPMATPSANLTYRFSIYLDQTTLGIGCTGNTLVIPSIQYQDPNAAAPAALAMGTFTIVNNGVLGSNVTPNITFTTGVFRAKSGVQVQFSTAYTLGATCAPGPSVQVFPILEQVTAN